MACKETGPVNEFGNFTCGDGDWARFADMVFDNMKPVTWSGALKLSDRTDWMVKVKDAWINPIFEYLNDPCSDADYDAIDAMSMATSGCNPEACGYGKYDDKEIAPDYDPSMWDDDVDYGNGPADDDYRDYAGEYDRPEQFRHEY